MKAKDLQKLTAGEKVNHRHYGPCYFQSYVPNFGPLILPATEEGKKRLKADSGTDAPMLETSLVLLKPYNPNA